MTINIDIEKEICNLYQQERSSIDISKKIDVSKKTVLNVLYRNNIEIRRQKRYNINSNFFDNIDTENKAYILGILFADGYNSEERGYFSINLHERDIDILKKIRDIIYNEDRPLYYIPAKNGSSPQYKLYISNIHMVKKLSEHGCIQRKSPSLKFPNNLGNPLIRHFLRGYFDGDGCFSYGKYKMKSYGKQKYLKASCYITGTQEFCSDFKSQLKTMGINSSIFKPTRHKKENTFRADIGGNKQISKFMDWIYNNASIYMERKYNKYQEFKKTYGAQYV